MPLYPAVISQLHLEASDEANKLLVPEELFLCATLLTKGSSVWKDSYIWPCEEHVS